MFCEIYLQSAAHITIGSISTVSRVRSLILPEERFGGWVWAHFPEQRLVIEPNITTIRSLTDPRSTILYHRSSILDPNFPVNLKVLLIMIILFFYHWSNHLFQSNQSFQAIAEFVDRPVPEKLDMGFLFYGHEVLQVECADSQVQSYPYKHIRDTYVTLGWISTDAFLAPHVKARK